MSGQRQILHRRIDRVYLSAPLNTEATALLDELEQREQELSARRRSLHARIDRLRDAAGLAPGPKTSEPSAFR